MEETFNNSGLKAYRLPDEDMLLGMLNTCKLQPQFYRNPEEQVTKLQALIYSLATEDPYFVAQCIVWSRCCGEGLRTINYLAAAILAQYISGLDWAKRFYGRFDKKTADTDHPTGGCIFRLDDMLEIKNMYHALNEKPLSNAMKKAFVRNLETASAYELTKYKKTVIDIANLVHPDSSKSNAHVLGEFGEMKAIDAILSGIPINAETWEAQNSQTGQEIAKKVQSGELNEEEAKQALTEALNENWKNLLDENKLGILAAIRNIRNILKGADDHVVESLCNLISNPVLIRQGKIMPYQMEQAHTIVDELYSPYKRQVREALEKGMVEALPNFAELLPGKTCVIIDESGSMTCPAKMPDGHNVPNSRCIDKAAILGAMLAKGTNADVVVFGSEAKWFEVNPYTSVFDMARELKRMGMGCTNIGAAFDLLFNSGKVYDRIFLLSDYEANSGATQYSYQKYSQICSPYLYCIDFNCYGTVPFSKNPNIHYFNGYGYSMLDNITKYEFRAQDYLDQVKQVII